MLLAALGLFHAAGRHTNVFASHLIEHLHLTGKTARLVHETFGTASQNATSATAVAVIGFLLWGIGIGQIYQDVYARAWRLRVRAISDQARFTIWFFVLTGLLGLYVVFAGSLRTVGWVAVIPVWLAVSIGFWLWTPRLLLHRKISYRQLFPGALLASIILGLTTALSRFFVGPSLNADARRFGSAGVVIELLAWGYTLAIVSLVCAVFSPVWAEWRERERARRPVAHP
jgi:membrane protein